MSHYTETPTPGYGYNLPKLEGQRETNKAAFVEFQDAFVSKYEPLFQPLTSEALPPMTKAINAYSEKPHVIDEAGFDENGWYTSGGLPAFKTPWAAYDSLPVNFDVNGPEAITEFGMKAITLQRDRDWYDRYGASIGIASIFLPVAAIGLAGGVGAAGIVEAGTVEAAGAAGAAGVAEFEALEAALALGEMGAGMYPEVMGAAGAVVAETATVPVAESLTWVDLMKSLGGSAGAMLQGGGTSSGNYVGASNTINQASIPVNEIYVIGQDPARAPALTQDGYSALLSGGLPGIAAGISQPPALPGGSVSSGSAGAAAVDWKTLLLIGAALIFVLKGGS